MDISYDAITFISKFLYLKKPRAGIFSDITKIVTMFGKIILKE